MPFSKAGSDLASWKNRLETDFFGEGEWMVRKPRAPAMSKEAMRQESERLVREAMARNVTITQGKTRLDVKCSKYGAPNRVSAEMDQAGWNTPARNAAINKRPCDQKTQWVFGHCWQGQHRSGGCGKPTYTEAACGRRSWMSSAGQN